MIEWRQTRPFSAWRHALTTLGLQKRVIFHDVVARARPISV